MASPIPSCLNPIPSLFGCYNNYSSTDSQSFTVWNNITKVVDYNRDASNNPISASGIDPYARLIETDLCNGPNSCGQYIANNSTPICGVPTGSAGVDWIDCEDEDGFSSIDYNCYEETTASIDVNSLGQASFDSCRKYAFKNLRTQKYWQGRYGYQSDTSFPPLSASYSISGSLNAVGGTLVFSSPDNTRYRTVDFNATAIFNNTVDDTTETYTYEQGITVNQYSGMFTLDSCERSPDTSSVMGGFTQFAQDLVVYGNATLAYLIGVFTPTVSDGTDLYSGTYDGTTETVTDNNPSSDTYGKVIQTVSCNFLNHFQITNYGLAIRSIFDPPTYGLLNVTTVDTTNTTLLYSYFAPEQSGLIVHKSATSSLSNTYTSEQVTSDLYTLQSQWDLSDDVIYPPRSDENVSQAPLVYYSEQYVDFGLQGTNTTCSVGLPVIDVDGNPPNGQIYGGPLPSPGFERFWDGAHDNYGCCTDDEGSNYEISSYGAYSPDYMPTTTTRWTNTIQAGNGYNGTWVRMFGNLAEMQMFVEVPIRRPSWNFARPCELDRWTLDAGSTRCLTTAGSGSSFNIDIVSATNINSGDIVYVYAGSGPASTNGVYSVASKNSDTNYTLNNNHNWNTTPNDYSANETSFVSKLIFPTCPGICGETSVISAFQLNSSSFQFTVNSGTSIQQGDTLSFVNVISGSGTSTATVSYSIDNNNFVANGTANPSYAGSGFVYATTSPSFDWNDNSSKGYFLMLDWSYNYRDISQYVDPHYNTTSSVRYNQTINGIPQAVNHININQECNATDPCGVCYYGYVSSVLSQSFNSCSVINDVPSDFHLDYPYGSLWQGIPIQFFTDILWQPTARACYKNEFDEYTFNPCPMDEDDGSCNTDTCDDTDGFFYYYQRPFFEAIQINGSTFEGVTYPPLPSGYKIGYYTLAQLSATTQVVTSSNVPVPPAQIGLDMSSCGGIFYYQTDWGNLERQNGCVCAMGRFEQQYIANFATCELFEI